MLKPLWESFNHNGTIQTNQASIVKVIVLFLAGSVSLFGPKTKQFILHQGSNHINYLKNKSNYVQIAIYILLSCCFCLRNFLFIHVRSEVFIINFMCGTKYEGSIPCVEQIFHIAIWPNFQYKLQNHLHFRT